jgi:hypothetical protein
MTRAEPTIEEKIRALPDLGELEGAEGWLVKAGQMTPRIKNIIELRRRELKQGLVALLCFCGFPADAQDTIRIGNNSYINGTAQTQTTVNIRPSDKPGQLAVVTLDNRYVNDGQDDGTYFIAVDGLVAEIEFTWDAEPLIGADRILVIPPEGILCLPASCEVTVMEGFTGQVVLLDWEGM